MYTNKFLRELEIKSNMKYMYEVLSNPRYDCISL